jgi:hypothetical protein
MVAGKKRSPMTPWAMAGAGTKTAAHSSAAAGNEKRGATARSWNLVMLFESRCFRTVPED